MHEKTAKKCQKNALREELTVGLPRAKTNISALQTRAETEQTNDKKMSEKTAEKCSKNLHKIVPKKPKNNTPCRPLVTTIECSQKQQQEIQQCAKPCHTNLRKNTPVHSLPRQLSNLPPRLLENLHTTVPKSHKTDQNMPPTRDDTQILAKTTKQCPKICKNTPVHSLPRQKSNLPLGSCCCAQAAVRFRYPQIAPQSHHLPSPASLGTSAAAPRGTQPEEAGSTI